MKKVYFISFVLFFSVILAGCNLVNQEKPAAIGNDGFIGTLKEALSSGKSLKCQWNQDNNSGVTYIKGNNYYAQYQAEGKKGNVIFKNNCLWTWEEGQDQGFNMCFEENIIEGDQESDQANQYSGMPSQNVAFDCQAELVGDDKFTQPANINFVDMDQMMKGMPEGSGSEN